MEARGDRCGYSIHMGSTPRSPRDWDGSRRATLFCVNLLSGAWQSGALQVAAGGCSEARRGPGDLRPSLPFSQHLQLSSAIIGPHKEWAASRRLCRRGDESTKPYKPAFTPRPLASISRNRHLLQSHMMSSQTVVNKTGVADVQLKIDPAIATRHLRRWGG